ncbi:hypothetical protein QBC39DRAFT_438223 [Podospora conica]|nr:hypothetical protein QBC39DRAFT_438223 [Schizothecium conicum]
MAADTGSQGANRNCQRSWKLEPRRSCLGLIVLSDGMAENVSHWVFEEIAWFHPGFQLLPLSHHPTRVFNGHHLRNKPQDPVQDMRSNVDCVAHHKNTHGVDVTFTPPPSPAFNALASAPCLASPRPSIRIHATVHGTRPIKPRGDGESVKKENLRTGKLVTHRPSLQPRYHVSMIAGAYNENGPMDPTRPARPGGWLDRPTDSLKPRSGQDHLSRAVLLRISGPGHSQHDPRHSIFGT